jgi:hypothetical protein
MNISLKNAVVILDEAHNVESTLCESGSGQYAEFDLYSLSIALTSYSRRNEKTGNITLITRGIDVDTAKVAHDLLLFVERIIFHLQKEKTRFENGSGRQKLERDYRKFHNTPDDHQEEISYDGPTGWGLRGKPVGCNPFLERLDITKDECANLLELAISMEQEMFGGKQDGQVEETGQGDASNVLTILIELLSKLMTGTFKTICIFHTLRRRGYSVPSNCPKLRYDMILILLYAIFNFASFLFPTAVEHPEHFYIACVAQGRTVNVCCSSAAPEFCYFSTFFISLYQN